MKYEIDFIGVNEESSKDAAATCFRFYSPELKRYVIVVYDGGFSVHGKALVELIKKYYTPNGDQDDLISIGTIGLIKGISTFKPDKKVRLATYASRCIENATLS